MAWCAWKYAIDWDALCVDLQSVRKVLLLHLDRTRAGDVPAGKPPAQPGELKPYMGGRLIRLAFGRSASPNGQLMHLLGPLEEQIATSSDALSANQQLGLLVIGISPRGRSAGASKEQMGRRHPRRKATPAEPPASTGGMSRSALRNVISKSGVYRRVKGSGLASPSPAVKQRRGNPPVGADRQANLMDPRCVQSKCGGPWVAENHSCSAMDR